MRCYISSQCSGRTRILDAVEELSGLGFQRIELTGGTQWHPGLADDLRRLEAKPSLSLMVHNYFPPQPEEFVMNLAVRSPERRARLFSFIRDMAERAKRMRASVLGLHPGFRQDVGIELINGYFCPGDDGAASEASFWDSLPELDAIAQATGIRICLENLAPRSPTDRFSFVTHLDEIRELLQRVRRTTAVGMLVDLGHLNVASAMLGFDRAAALEEILRAHDRIFQFHLSHNDGTRDAHAPNPEGCWQVSFASSHRRRFRGIPVVMEWSRSATAAHKQHFDRIVGQLESL